MARLIVKSPYIKCGGNQGADGYMRYIATRERVEIIPDDRPPTRKQEQLITKLTKDFPDVKELLEYDDYVQKPTKANASSLITLALEEHWKQVQQTDGYMKYIATRPVSYTHLDVYKRQVSWCVCLLDWWHIFCYCPGDHSAAAIQGHIKVRALGVFCTDFFQYLRSALHGQF